MNLNTTPPTDYITDGQGGVSREADEPTTERDWVSLARWCYQDGENWLEQAYRSQWEKNLKLFKSQHPPGSKYLSADYAGRSKLFRPKVRSTVLKSEAAVASAFFTTDDVVSLRPMDDNDPVQLASAEIWTQVINYRLRVSVPWFKLVVGAKQDCDVMGACVSRQDWQYETNKDGSTRHDRPRVTLVPLENIRCSPGADWTDPVNSSPYWIDKVPMFVCDVKAMAQRPPRPGQTVWLEVDDGVLMKARQTSYDTTRQTREGNQAGDPKDQPATLRDHDVVWVHHNYIRVDGEDWFYLTAGDEALLSKPILAREINRLGDERPYCMGFGLIEAHRSMPASRVELLQDVQAMANEIANQRIDNVKLAMNGRYFVRNGKVTDTASLKRSVPGAVTYMMDPATDVVWHRPGDVTASSYAEQDRLNVDFDELAGAFSPSSVQSNRKLNETVGGMNLLAMSANGMQEYGLRVFANTWVEPVVRQLVKLEQAYETDLTLIAIAASKANVLQRFGIDRITDELLGHSLTADVNVGLAANNPDARLQKFIAAATAVGTLVGPKVVGRIREDEVIKEIFGHAGYKDGSRFFEPKPDGAQQPAEPPPDPKLIETQHKMGLADMEAQAKIRREDVLAMADLRRKSVMDAADRDRQLVAAFGGATAGAGLPAPQGQEAIEPAVANDVMGRLRAFLEQSEAIGQAVQQITTQLGPMQQAIRSLAEGQRRLDQSHQSIAQDSARVRQVIDRQRQDAGRTRAQVDRVMQYLMAPKRVDRGRNVVRVDVPGGVIERPIVRDAAGNVSGLGAPA